MQETAVYWGPPVEDGDGGHTFPAPVEISCRWDGVEGRVVDPRSHDVLDNSSVMVDRDVAIDGYLFLGELTDVGSSDPDELDGAHKIVGFQKIPDRKAREYLRIATV
jgi:hypothetical protein